MSEPVVIGSATLYLGDCLDILPTLGPADVVITDPPYGVTDLHWDKCVTAWPALVSANQIWCFGALRYLLKQPFDGWTYAQEIVWEKHNGSNFHADRFRRVHELAVHYYRGVWADLYHETRYTADAVAKTVRRKAKPAHTGHIQGQRFESHDGGPRMMRSVIRARSCHGYAQHPTQKPIEILQPLIEYSCPPGGAVLDPFMGSGSAGVASWLAGRSFIGIEIERKYFDIACERIRAVQAQGRLFA